MANIDNPNGLSYKRSLNGIDPAPIECFVPASDGTLLGVGDPVKLHGSGSTAGHCPTVIRSGASDVAFGVVRSVNQIKGVALTSQNLFRKHRPVSTGMYVLVDLVLPTSVFEIQEDSVGGALTADSIGLNCDFTTGNCNTTTGQSIYELDSSTALDTSGLAVKILKLADRPDNELGTNAKWEVIFNDTQFVAGVTGV